MVDRPTLGTEMFALGQKQLETILATQETLTDFHGNEAKKFCF